MKIYKKAVAHNCTEKIHHFKLVGDKIKKKAIQSQLPKLIYPLWECVYCNKITQST